MKVPFPGMDPYLEHPLLWPGVPNRLIVTLANQLQPLIEPRYLASLEERVFVEGPQRDIPDLQVRKLRESGGTRVAVAPAADKPVVIEVAAGEVHEAFIEILDRYANLKVVAVIEVVSPSNKTTRSGRRSYLAKQKETLAGDRHLVEIDLLRRGRHLLSVPRSRLEELGPYDYLVCVSRWPQRNRFELYPRQLREPLPRISLPLVSPDPDVSFDIQATLEQVYVDARYMLRLRYDEPCQPPLSPENQSWANECWSTYRAAHPELFSSATT